MERTLEKGNIKFLFIYEFLGTAMLAWGENLGTSKDPWGPVFNIFAIILVVGPITGAHINPAVTTGILISNQNILVQLPIYLLTVIAQITGAMFGSLLAFTCMQNKYTANLPNHQRGSVPLSEFDFLMPKPGITGFNAFMIEMICTFMLVLLVLTLHTARLSPSKEGLLGCIGACCLILSIT